MARVTAMSKRQKRRGAYRQREAARKAKPLTWCGNCTDGLIIDDGCISECVECIRMEIARDDKGEP